MKAFECSATRSSVVEHLQQLLGPCVLIGCTGKRPIKSNWQKIALSDMTPQYLLGLSERNIGVSLGKASDGLVTIDFDTEEALNTFLAANPKLHETLRTRGRRGANLWIRLEGEVPPSTKLTGSDKSPVGEWRSTGNQTIISGVHPETRRPYQILVESPPTTITASQLCWPESVTPTKWPFQNCGVDKHRSKEAQRSTETTDEPSPSLSSASTLLHHSTETRQVALDEEAAFAGKFRLGICQLYDELVGVRYRPQEGARNAFITHAVPFLMRAVTDELVLAFSQHFFRLNQMLFKDSEQEHMCETRAMLENALRGYEVLLGDEEASIYQALSEKHKSLFRICQDLAFNVGPKAPPPPLFFLAEGELADRLNIHPQEARRSLFKFQRLLIMAIEVPGTSHSAKRRGVATQFRWLLKGATPLHGEG